MSSYVQNTLKKLRQKLKVSPQYSLCHHNSSNYTKQNTQQYATTPDTSPYMFATETIHIQSILGYFLYYIRALDDTIISALNAIDTQQALPTRQQKDNSRQFIDYSSTYYQIYTYATMYQT